MIGHNEGAAQPVISPGVQPSERVFTLWLAGLFGALSFAGWLGAAALDGSSLRYDPLWSFLVHLPLMLLPTVLILIIGLPRLPAGERTFWRVAGACGMILLLSSPALAPELTQPQILLPFRLPVVGLGFALGFVDPVLRRAQARGIRARLPPAFVTGLLFGVGIVITSIVAIGEERWRVAHTPCQAIHCVNIFRGFAEVALCGAGVLTASLAVAGVSFGHVLGETLLQPRENGPLHAA